jgi:Tfp pilus assembly protein FimT
VRSTAAVQASRAAAVEQRSCALLGSLCPGNCSRPQRWQDGAAKGGQVGLNRYKARTRHLFNWAIAQGYRDDDTPFKRQGVNVV